MASRDYKNGKIYCIRNTVDDNIYVGSTTQPLSKRMVKHRCDAKTRPEIMVITTHMSKLGIENFYIELLEECPCDNIEQLCRKEGEWIRKLGTLNQKIQGRTKNEYFKEITENKQLQEGDYRDNYLSKRKEYRAKNIDKLRAQDNALYHAKSYEERKQIYEKRKEWKTCKHKCECGSFYTNSHKSGHMKTKKHQNWLQQQNTND